MFVLYFIFKYAFLTNYVQCKYYLFILLFCFRIFATLQFAHVKVFILLLHWQTI